MNRQKIGSIVLGAVLIAVVATAAVLYQSLSKSYGKGAIPAVSSGSTPSSKAAESAESAGTVQSSSQQSSEEAPNFTVYDSDGNNVKLSDFRGKPVVLNFWASWCTYCKQEMPDFNELYKKDKDKVVFLFVDCTDGSKETKEKAQAFLKQQGYDFPVYYDFDQDAVTQYGLTGLPATVFIDRNGCFVSGRIGLYDKDSLEAGIAQITG